MTDTIQGAATLAAFVGDDDPAYWGLYRTSYDWLIPVWVKFRESFQGYHYIKHESKCTKIQHAMMYGTILDAFTALVEAVEWWNGLNEKEVGDG